MPVPRGLPSVAADEGRGSPRGVGKKPLSDSRDSVQCSARPLTPALSPEGRGGKEAERLKYPLPTHQELFSRPGSTRGAHMDVRGCEDAGRQMRGWGSRKTP